MSGLNDLLARGTDAGQELIDSNKSTRKGGGNRKRLEYLSLKGDGESIVVRFLSESSDMITVLQHSFTPTRPEPEDLPDGWKWPTMTDAVCRETDNVNQLYPDGCYICREHHKVVGKNKKSKSGTYYSSPRSWILAAVRAPVVVESEADQAEYGYTIDESTAPLHTDLEIGDDYIPEIGDVIGYRDEEVEVDVFDDEGEKTGTKMAKRIVVINHPWKTFFGSWTRWAKTNKTMFDRDYKIERSGAGPETDYKIMALDPSTQDNGDPFDLRRKEYVVEDGERTATGRRLVDVYLDDAPDLVGLIEFKLSDQVYRYFDPSIPFEQASDDDEDGDDKPKAKSGGASKPKAAATPAKEVKPETKRTLADLRKRVKTEHAAPATAAAG